MHSQSSIKSKNDYSSISSESFTKKNEVMSSMMLKVAAVTHKEKEKKTPFNNLL